MLLISVPILFALSAMSVIAMSATSAALAVSPFKPCSSCGREARYRVHILICGQPCGLVCLIRIADHPVSADSQRSPRRRQAAHNPRRSLPLWRKCRPRQPSRPQHRRRCRQPISPAVPMPSAASCRNLRLFIRFLDAFVGGVVIYKVDPTSISSAIVPPPFYRSCARSLPALRGSPRPGAYQYSRLQPELR